MASPPSRKKHGILVHTADQPMEVWLEQAKRERSTAHDLVKLGRERAAAVFAHLAIEKALKAYYRQKHERHPPVSHNLVYLAERTNLLLPDELKQRLEALNDVSIVHLYSGTPEPSENVDALLEATDRLFDWITDHLTSAT